MMPIPRRFPQPPPTPEPLPPMGRPFISEVHIPQEEGTEITQIIVIAKDAEKADEKLMTWAIDEGYDEEYFIIMDTVPINPGGTLLRSDTSRIIY